MLLLLFGEEGGKKGCQNAFRVVEGSPLCPDEMAAPPSPAVAPSLAPHELPAAALPILMGPGYSWAGSELLLQPLGTAASMLGGSLIVPSDAGEAAQPTPPAPLASPCHVPTGAGAGLSQTCFGGPQHNTGFTRDSPGALIWGTPKQPLMNPHTRVRVQGVGNGHSSTQCIEWQLLLCRA